MRRDPPTLRSKLLRWVLVPLSVVLLADVIGSYVAVGAIVQSIYDGELAEIARELVLHLRADGQGIAFDLSSDAERTLLLDQYDHVYYSVHAADGRVIAHLAIIQDVTERKRAERTLRESEEHFRSLVENLNDVFLRYDLGLRRSPLQPIRAACI